MKRYSRSCFAAGKSSQRVNFIVSTSTSNAGVAAPFVSRTNSPGDSCSYTMSTDCPGRTLVKSYLRVGTDGQHADGEKVVRRIVLLPQHLQAPIAADIRLGSAPPVGVQVRRSMIRRS